MLDDADLYARYLQQVCYLTAYFFNEAYLHARIDEVRDLIAPHVYADDNKMYSSADFDTNIEADLSGSGGGPMGGQTYGLKPFVTNRAAHIAAQLDCSTLSLEDASTSAWTVFPNPARDEITILSSTPCEADLTLRNTLGQIVLRTRMSSALDIHLDVAGLASGLHILDIHSSGKLLTRRKVIIE